MTACLRALALMALGACATLRNDTTVCPESRDLRCGTDPVCSYDEARQCRVCRCAAPFHADPADPAPMPGSEPD
ncbi:MAG: hypothetical protein HYY06_02635 [Deltaproteobacteria bacterium]|nr:hypothetical protein [Deltaproteobacteria bacterium]